MDDAKLYPVTNRPDAAQSLRLRLQEHSSELLAYLRGRLGPQEAEDALQTVLLKAVEKLDTLKRDTALRGWLYQIARNTIVDVKRKSGREPPYEGLHPATAESDAGVCACATSLTKNLSPAQAELVRLVDIGESTIAEAAKSMGASVGATTVKLHRARKRLRQEVAQLCGASDYRGASACECDSEQCG